MLNATTFGSVVRIACATVAVSEGGPRPSTLPLGDHLLDIVAVFRAAQLLARDDGDAADAHPNPGALDEHDRVFLDHAAQVRHDLRLPFERSVRIPDAGEERRLLVFRQ